MTSDDARLIERFRSGDREAVATVDAWLARAASPFRRRTANEWEDILQDVRLEVVRLLEEGRFRGESRLKTYLWRVTAHTFLDALRRRRRAVECPDLEADALPSKEPSLLERVVEAERSRAMLNVLESTSPECRRLWRAILEGRSYGEMARQLEVSEGALRVRVHRCRKAALELLSGNVKAASTPVN